MNTPHPFSQLSHDPLFVSFQCRVRSSAPRFRHACVVQLRPLLLHGVLARGTVRVTILVPRRKIGSCLTEENSQALDFDSRIRPSNCEQVHLLCLSLGLSLAADCAAQPC
jgi:hypothetical protein